MIRLHLNTKFGTLAPPFVAKVRFTETRETAAVQSPSEIVAFRDASDPEVVECSYSGGNFNLSIPPNDPLDGDVLLCVPSRGLVNRLFRRASRHNTLLLTERCDQLCVMCSQPPKKSQDEWRFPLYEKALLLVDRGAMVGISGGEPTLYKKELFGIIERAAKRGQELSYHILSNGQHFTSEDEASLRELHSQVRIVWGIPLYSNLDVTHEKIVGKDGAFKKAVENLFLLGATGAEIELRTVITSLNVFDLPHLANFVANNIPFVSTWAIMAMEPIGYAKANWQQLFFDHSEFPQPIINALEIAKLRGINCRLYNVPLCTVPSAYRRHCSDSISDWKKKFLPECDDCSERGSCSGFFEWYNLKVAWSGIAPIRG